MVPRKRLLSEITKVLEPDLNPERLERFHEGIALFDAGKHWLAHEAWEDVWREMSNRPEDDAEIVIRGLIQLAAAMHLARLGRHDGSLSNFRKAREKLSVAGERFLGIDMEPVRRFIDARIAEGDYDAEFRLGDRA